MNKKTNLFFISIFLLLITPIFISAQDNKYQSISYGESVVNFINDGNSHNYFSFIGERGDQIEILLTILFPNLSNDISIKLWEIKQNESWNLIAEDLNSNPSEENKPLIELILPNDGEYIIEVSQKGWYQLSLIKTDDYLKNTSYSYSQYGVINLEHTYDTYCFQSPSEGILEVEVKSIANDIGHTLSLEYLDETTKNWILIEKTNEPERLSISLPSIKITYQIKKEGLYCVTVASNSDMDTSTQKPYIYSSLIYFGPKFGT